MTLIAIGPGCLLDLLNPDPELIDFDEIAAGLARRLRYGPLAGAYITWSVAQHTLWVADQVSEAAKPWALLHDAHEHYLGDDPRPKLQALEHLEWGDGSISATDQLKCCLDIAIHLRAGLMFPPPPGIWEEVDAADDLAMVTEINVLMSPAMAATFDLSGFPHPASKESIRAIWVQSGSPGLVLADRFRKYLPALKEPSHAA